MKSHTASGGVAVFIKDNFTKYFSEVRTDDQNTIWLKMKKELVGGEEDIFLGTTYLSPTAAKHTRATSDKTDIFFKNCALFNQKGKVLIQGDLNAHTNTESDTIKPDKFDELLGIKHNPTLPERNSQDKKSIDDRGKELLEFCKSNDFNIINGRKIGDTLGQNTCYQWNGTSLVDYVISSYHLYNQIDYFQVGKFIPWISDHCPLHYSLKTETKINLKKRTPKLVKIPNQYFWDTGCKEKLMREFSSETSKIYFDRILNEIEDADDIAEQVTDVFHVALNNAKIKIKKNKKNF